MTGAQVTSSHVVRQDERDQRLGIETIPPWLIVLAALATALLFGRLVAGGHLKYGVALVLAACFVPLVFFDLARALAVWVAIQFVSDLSALSSGANAVGVLIGLGWLGAFLGRRDRLLLLRGHSRLLLIIVALLIWMTLSIAWAVNAAEAANEAAYWAMAGFGFLILLTTVNSPRDVNWVLLAFVVGAVISVIIGLSTGSLAASATATSSTAIQGRFTGGGGDPNAQAAGFVAAMFLIIGLFSVYANRRARLLLLLCFLLVAVGFFATQSRGGLIALAVASLAALVVAPRQRKRVLGLIALVALAGALLVSTTPGSLTRITDLGGGTSGRSDLWRVGWEVFKGHPFVGVGAGNFVSVESHYVLRPGPISRVQYVAEVPHVVHNTYLQLLAETGVVGLFAFLAVIGVCLRAAYLAARRFEAIGRPDYADLTRAIVMGTIGMLAALFLISDGNDPRLWVLLALGPVLLGIAGRETPRTPPT